ncbi:MAG: bifunctional GNAT family N-acetyltransferase/carbon-nitrogen hydrolase family protein [Polyangiales bacterium]
MAEGSKTSGKPRVVVRQLEKSDFRDVQRIHKGAYPQLESWTLQQFVSQLQLFPEGQLCVEVDGRVVATSSSLIINIHDLSDTHTYQDVCEGGMIRTHDPDGDTLYGIDIAVDPAFRGQRFARRIYDERKELAQRLNLRGIIFGGRMPNYGRHASEMSPQEYLAKVLRKEIRDPVIVAQIANGFVAREVIEDYLPSDTASSGHAVLMEWRNPTFIPPDPRRRTAPAMRVAAVQYQMRTVSNFDEFATQCEFFIDSAADYRVDFLLFPELLTTQLLALVPDSSPAQSARALDQFTERYVSFFHTMAIQYNINIIAGTHLAVEKKRLYNIAYLFHRDGRIDRQYKTHVTPSESRWWGITPGRDIDVFETDRGKIAIAICYDVEFPEYVRIIKAKGADVLFVPYNTDIRSGHIRVRSCSLARAIENHIYVVMAGAVGNLPQVEGADIHYGQASILTPSDIQFARDGIASEGTPNAETMIVHDLDLGLLRRTEGTGTVRTWPDRRKDLYAVIHKSGRKSERF